MPTNPKDEFVWSSIDRSSHRDQLLQQTKEKMVTLSFDTDFHPLGLKYATNANVVNKKPTKELKNNSKVKSTSKNVETKQGAIFIDPLSAMSATPDEDQDQYFDDAFSKEDLKSLIL